jgi:predicted amidophosphoribosyltransferase
MMAHLIVKPTPWERFCFIEGYHCSACGARVTELHRYCPKCGVQLVRKGCTDCNRITRTQRDTYCWTCGAELQPVVQDHESDRLHVVGRFDA